MQLKTTHETLATDLSNHLDGSMCQGGVAGGVIIGPRPSYGPEGGDKVDVIEPEKSNQHKERT